MSTLKVNAISNVAGTGSPNITEQAKAWVNFNGTGTVAIQADFNVTSITDNGTGDYTANFTTAMTDANYVLGGTCGNVGGVTNGNIAPINFTVSSCRFGTRNQASNVSADRDLICATIHR